MRYQREETPGFGSHEVFTPVSVFVRLNNLQNMLPIEIKRETNPHFRKIAATLKNRKGQSISEKTSQTEMLVDEDEILTGLIGLVSDSVHKFLKEKNEPQDTNPDE
jgi:hypothetical protein